MHAPQTLATSLSDLDAAASALPEGNAPDTLKSDVLGKMQDALARTGNTVDTEAQAAAAARRVTVSQYRAGISNALSTVRAPVSVASGSRLHRDGTCVRRPLMVVHLHSPSAPGL